MHVTDIFHLDVVLDWVVDREVDPGGRDQCLAVFCHDNWDGRLPERRFTLYELWLLSERICNGVLVRN